MKKIYDIHPQKVYKANIDKNESFHLETLNEAIRTMQHTTSVISHGSDMETSENKYTSAQKMFWSDSPTYGREFNNPVFKEVFDFVNKCANEYLVELRVDPNIYQVKMTNAYLNRCNEDPHGQPPHNHRGAFLSYSYYFHLKGSVQPLIFGSPTQADEYFFPFGLCTDAAEAEFFPSVGDVIMFPGYLLHKIPPEETNAGRWLFNGDFHVFSDAQPNLPDRIS